MKHLSTAFLLALFVGVSIAGQATVRTITLTDKAGTTVVVSETPGPDGAAPTLSVVATLPDGTTLKGIGKGTPDSNGNWDAAIPLTASGDGDGAGILPHDKDYKLKLHADPELDDGVPDIEGGEIDFKSYGLGHGQIPLLY